MGGAEEQHINSVQGQLISESHISLTYQTLMYCAQLIACIAGTVYKHNLCIRMPQQDTYQFTGSITCTSYYSNFNHILSFLIRVYAVVSAQRG